MKVINLFYSQGWLEDWTILLNELNEKLNEKTKLQLVIFLTHNEQPYEVNMGWHPKAEEVLWKPDLQK